MPGTNVPTKTLGSVSTRHRIERDVDVVDPRRLIQPRRLRRVVPLGHEHGGGLRRVPRRVPEEAQAVVERQRAGWPSRCPARRTPRCSASLDLGEGVDLGVVLERADERIGVAVVGVEGVVRVGVERELPGPRPRADAAVPFGVLRELEVVARLDRMVALDPRQIGAKGRQPRFALIDQPVVEREVRAVGRR